MIILNIFLTANRSSFNGNIIDFYFNDRNKMFITGQRGIGKTTTILYQFYTNDVPFFYINLKNFLNSKNELEKDQIIEFEKNNLFRPQYMTYLSDVNKRIINYENDIEKYFNIINNMTYDNNIKKIKYISTIIKILILLHKELEIIKNKESEVIQNYINIIFEKIKLLEIPAQMVKDISTNLNSLILENDIQKVLDVLLMYKAYLSYLIYVEDMPESNIDDIWEFIESLLKECNKLNLEFILILDKYKNEYSEGIKLQNIIDNYKNSKIIICSSIDDYRIRYALINGVPKYILIKEDLVSLENIKIKYSDIFYNISGEKNKIIKLFKNNTKEIFNILYLEDDKLKEYVNGKIEKIKIYFKYFCKSNLARISFLIFIFRNINCYWNKEDYNQIRKFIPLKYFIFEKIFINSNDIENQKYSFGKLDEKDIKNDEIIKTSKEKGEKDDEHFYYKINYSMPIVGNALYKYIRDEDIIVFFEQIMQTSKKGSGKGITFKEYIKTKMSKSKFIPLKNLHIDDTIEIWSLFSDQSSSDVIGLFGGKLENNKIYLIDIKNQTEPMFDCAIINLIKKEMIFIQITISKEITSDIFNRNKVKTKSKEALQFLKGNIIEENIELDRGFFFVFLKYDIDENQEYLDESNEELFNYMKKINNQLDIMIKKCKEENLSYCIYNLFTNFSKKTNPLNTALHIIDPDENNNFYIDKKNENNNLEKAIKSEEIKLTTLKGKRNYMNMAFSSISLNKIDLKVDKFIKKFYDFYVEKFNLKNIEIYEEMNNLYTFENLEKICKSTHCFALLHNLSKNNDFNNIIYYESELVIENINNRQKDNIFNDHYNKELYNIYFLGNENEIKSNILKIQETIGDNFSKKKKYE